MLVHASPILSGSVDTYLREGDFAEALEEIQHRHPTVEIGSYPFNRDGRLGATLVARGTDRTLLSKVVAEIGALQVERAERVRRPVDGGAAPGEAIDALVRARRPA